MSAPVEVPPERRRPFFTPTTLAQYLAVHPRTIRQWIADKKIASYVFEGSRRIAAEDVDEYIARHRDGGA